VAEGIIEIKALAREAGYRTKVAVKSADPRVHPVGACVGIRGSRIKNIVDELGGEKIDIVPWNDSSKVLIANSLRPAEVAEIALCFELNRATVVVTEDQLSLAIGKRGQNVRLAAKLTDWDVDILTPNEFNTSLDVLEKALRRVEGVDSTLIDQIQAMGMVSVMDVEEVGTGPLVNELGMDRTLAERIVGICSEEAKRVAEQQAAAKRERKAEAAGGTAPPAGATPPAGPAPQVPAVEAGPAESAAAPEPPDSAAGPQDSAAAEPPDAAGDTGPREPAAPDGPQEPA
jgi:N utilization substance protein A